MKSEEKVSEMSWRLKRRVEEDWRDFKADCEGVVRVKNGMQEEVLVKREDAWFEQKMEALKEKLLL